MTVYHIDSMAGDDGNDGTGPCRAWRSLDRANTTVYKPGDRVLFRSGTAYRGQFRPEGSGTPESPVCVSATDRTGRARIDTAGEYHEAVLLDNVMGWEIRNLELTNTGEKREGGRAGVRIRLHDFGEASHIYLCDLFIHDVNGSNVKNDKAGGFGIVWENYGSTKQSRFSDVRIEGCHLVRCDRNGICGLSGFIMRDRWYPSLNVVIRNNLLEDIGGDGIVPIGTDGCLIEHNRLDGGRRRCEDYAAGIWPWACDNTVIQFNEVSGMKGTLDGQAFDSDDNCINTLFQYNYSHDNEGGFMLVCSCGDAEEGSAWLKNTVIRYNISQNDKTRLFHLGGPVKNTFIFNNTFYTSEGADLYAVFATEDNGWPGRTFFWNNIFYTDGRLEYKLGKGTDYEFRANAYFGRQDGLPDDPRAVPENPRLSAPGTGGEGFSSLDGYRLLSGSPCIGSGIYVKDNGGRDFRGVFLRDGSAPDRGAMAYQS